MAQDFTVKGITPNRAGKIYSKIADTLAKLGYEITVTDAMRLVTGKNTITQFQQDFKISYVWNDAYDKKYIMEDDAPLMTISLFGYTRQGFPDIIDYNLSARIPGTDFDWEGEDTDFSALVDAFIDDANSGILNSMSDYVKEVEEKDLSVPMYDSLDQKLEDSVLRIYEGLYRQIRENREEKTEAASLEDLEQKINTIMDALGLNDKGEEDEENKEEVEVKAEEISDVLPEEKPLHDEDTVEVEQEIKREEI